MLGRVLENVISLAITLAIVLTMVFFGVRALPGDAASIRGGADTSAAQVAAIRRELGLDRPLLDQYASFWGGVIRGDLGDSIRERRPVLQILADRIPVTLALAGTAFVLSGILGLVLGVLAGLLPASRLSQGVLGFTTLGLTLPEFWFGFLLILAFAVALPWFPIIGFVGGEGIGVALHHLALPALTLAVPRASQIARLARAQVLEERTADYVRTARGKGLPARITARHITANALPGLFPLLALQLGGLLTGTIVVEQVFGLPGLGLALLGAISARDYPVVQGITIVAVMAYVLVNLLADVLQVLADPRLRYG